MAQPKKKTSKGKRDQRRAVWKRKAHTQAEQALALGRSILSGNNTGFVYPQAEENTEGDEAS